MSILKGKEMIKNITYLDEDKMYSLSSQLFEGVTEYIRPLAKVAKGIKIRRHS